MYTILVSTRPFLRAIPALVLILGCGDGSASGGSAGSGGGDGGGGATGSTGGAGGVGGLVGPGGAGGAGGSEPEFPLEEGSYGVETQPFENDTCGTLTDSFMLTPVDLAWTNESEFTLSSEVLGEDYISLCTYTEASGAISCEEPPQDIGIPGGGVMSLTYGPVLGMVIDHSTFTLLYPVNVACKGAGCEGLETSAGFTFPCSFDGPAVLSR